jgi:nucleoside-diphosphate-sugar epimerase
MVRATNAEDVLAGFYAGRRVCLTGGAGFIGSHLATALIELGADVSVIDDLSNSDGRYVCDLIDRNAERSRFIYGSILDPRALREAVVGSRTVFHLAAMNSVPRSFEQPERTFEVNALGTLRVAEAARQARAERLVYAASSSAYGDDPALPKNESMLPRPMSPYAAGKLAGETVITSWARAYGLPGISLRLFNVFGPRQRAGDAYAAVVAAFCTRILAGQPPIIFGGGAQSRDFTPVASAVRAFLLAGMASEDPRGAVVNVALGRRITILDLARMIARLADRPTIEPLFREGRAGDVPHSHADITKARDLLGYEPVGTLEEALTETLDWYRSRSAEPEEATA